MVIINVTAPRIARGRNAVTMDAVGHAAYVRGTRSVFWGHASAPLNAMARNVAMTGVVEAAETAREGRYV